MARIPQAGQPGGGGSAYQETPEQKEAWKKLRSYMRSLNLGVGDTFTVKGTIAKVLLDGTDDNPRYFTKKQTKDDGSEYDWPFVKVMAAITDPQFGKPGTLDFPAKNVGASFFDGITKKGRSPNRGGMYNLHVAVTGEEPGEALKAGHGDWDTEDYENKPLLLRLVYQGKEEEGSAYADRRLGMRIFIAGFEKDRDVHRASSDLADDDDEAWSPATAPANATQAQIDKHLDALFPPAASSAPTAAARSSAPTTSAPSGPQATVITQNANLAVTPATDRQVQFIYAIGRECGMDKEQVAEWSDELFSTTPSLLTRRDASSLIDALQRKRQEMPAEGTDELVSVGVAAGPTKQAKPITPEDDDDLSF